MNTYAALLPELRHRRVDLRSLRLETIGDEGSALAVHRQRIHDVREQDLPSLGPVELLPLVAIDARENDRVARGLVQGRVTERHETLLASVVLGGAKLAIDRFARGHTGAPAAETSMSAEADDEG